MTARKRTPAKQPTAKPGRELSAMLDLLRRTQPERAQLIPEPLRPPKGLPPMPPVQRENPDLGRPAEFRRDDVCAWLGHVEAAVERAASRLSGEHPTEADLARGLSLALVDLVRDLLDALDGEGRVRLEFRERATTDSWRAWFEYIDALDEIAQEERVNTHPEDQGARNEAASRAARRLGLSREYFYDLLRGASRTSTLSQSDLSFLPQLPPRSPLRPRSLRKSRPRI